MKRLLFGLALGMLLAVGFAGVAMADNGPHGSFTATTDACASCHRVHTAQYGSNSLLVANPESLCLSCHDGAGAGTNVEDGIYVQAGSDHYYGTGASSKVEGDDGKSLFGGGFANALMATTWSGKATADPAFDAVSKPTTSNHSLGQIGTVWGSGAVNSANGSMVLECTSCHDPHGTAGYQINTTVTPNTATKVASYRLLRWQPQGSGGFTAPATSVNWSGGAFPSNLTGTTPQTGWLVPDNFPTVGTEWYTLGTTNAFAAGDYNAGNANDAYNPTGHNYRPAAINTAFFCAQCHDRYFNNSRLRNNTDASAYCGAPTAGVTAGTITLTEYPDADGVAPWIHPVDPGRCEPVVSTTTGLLTGWGDNGDSGDDTYKYRHTSGDIRLSMDGATAAGAGTTVSRSCMACHVSHGSTAQMTAFASGATLVPDAGDPGNNSVLLRMDNRSVCLRCHASTVNFPVGP